MTSKEGNARKGRINVDISAEVHKRARLYCVEHEITLGVLVESAIKLALDEASKKKSAAK